jgi:energy-converting hydrogenase Eha subunit C
MKTMDILNIIAVCFIIGLGAIGRLMQDSPSWKFGVFAIMRAGAGYCLTIAVIVTFALIGYGIGCAIKHLSP